MKPTRQIGLRVLSLVFLFLSVLLFSLAMYLYPGGNPIEKYTMSFDIGKNYICNLYSVNAINDLPNHGRIYAFAATAFLSVSFAITFYLIPIYLCFKHSFRLWTQSLGTTSMVLAFFIFTPFHDSVINVSGLLGTASLGIIFYHLWLQKEYYNLVLAILALICSGLTYIIYYSGYLFHTLALMQKMSLILFILWLGNVHLSLSKKNRAPKLINS